MKKLKKKFKLSSQRWISRDQKDKFTILSKKKGYRSRAYFKLLEVDKKFGLLKNNLNIIDLGSSPGSWSQLISHKNKSGLNLSIDKIFMKKINNVTFFQGDFTDSKTKIKIENFFKNKKIDLILSDIAENTTGNQNLDSIRTNLIAMEVLIYSNIVLKKNNGKAFIKFFNGLESDNILSYVKNNFSTYKIFKPESSRKISKEVYMLCIN